MPGWWRSIAAVRRFSRTMTMIAAACAMVGLVSWPITLLIAVPAFILVPVASLAALFSWFQLDDLRRQHLD